MIKVFIVFATSLFLLACNSNPTHLNVSSPDNNIELSFIVNQNGQPEYLIEYKNKVVIDTSYLGFNFVGEKPFESDLEIINSTISSFDETWETVWGEQR
jgi:glucan 1,4-alpha-glucosidase